MCLKICSNDSVYSGEIDHESIFETENKPFLPLTSGLIIKKNVLVCYLMRQNQLL
jgi:hypothetical protein